MADAFLQRSCPSCSGANPEPEVGSAPPAESLGLEALRPYWSGFYKEKLFFTYDRCAACGLLYAPTFFTGEQLGELYSQMAPNMDLVPSDALSATQRGYWQAAKSGTTLDGGYLEIGPDIGYIVREAAREGRFDHYWLVEPNRAVHEQLAAATNGNPHTLIDDMEDLSAVPDGSVGLAVMIHVLDHLLDPAATLKAVRAKLRPGGRLVIVTHNEASVLRSVMRKRWPPFCLQHPQLFNPKSIAQMVRGCGYPDVAVRRSTNYFPIDFMARQAAFTFGADLKALPLPKTAIGLKLGNMLTVADA